MSEFIREVSQTSGLDAFFAVAETVYRGDASYCVPFERGVKESLFRAEFQGRQAILVADVQGQPAARIVARVSPTLKEPTGKPIGMLGFFEARNCPTVVSALLDRAVDFLARQGVGMIIGPIDGDTWHKYRFTVGPFDSPPFLMEPYNPPYYADLWAARGFETLESYYSKVVDDATVAAANTERLSQRALSHGYALRPIRMDRFADELALMYSLSKRIFAHNFLYTDISQEDFFSLYAASRQILDPDFVWFIQCKTGEDVGFVFAFPDQFRAMAALHGRRNLVGMCRFHWLKWQTDTLNIKSLGVVPEHQRTGAAMALMNAVYRKAADKRFRHVNLCLIREGNSSGRMDGDLGRMIRRYVLCSLPPSKWRIA